MISPRNTLTLNGTVWCAGNFKLTVLHVEWHIIAVLSRPSATEEERTDENDIGELVYIIRLDDILHTATRCQVDVRVDCLTGRVLIAKVELFPCCLKVSTKCSNKVTIHFGTPIREISLLIAHWIQLYAVPFITVHHSAKLHVGGIPQTDRMVHSGKLLDNLICQCLWFVEFSG